MKSLRKKNEEDVSINNYDQLNIVKNEIIAVIANISRIDKNIITANTLIREELNIDSLMSMEILSTLEIKYRIRIKEEEAIKVSSVGEFIHLIYSIVKK